MCAGCAQSVEPLRRTLPDSRSLVADPVPLPEIRPGQDAREALAEARAAAAENARRLASARRVIDATKREFEK